MQSLWSVYVKDPILGVKHTIEDAADASASSIPVARKEDDVEILDSAETADTMAAYLADAAKTSDREPVFCADLGLAVEALPPGYSVTKLWTA
jgi:Bardet-Biedl syndrome 5 protein